MEVASRCSGAARALHPLAWLVLSVALALGSVACGGENAPPPVTMDPPGKPEPVQDWLLCECSGCTLNGVGSADQVVPSCIDEGCGSDADFSAICSAVCSRWGFESCASTEPVEANGCMVDSCAVCLESECSAGSCFTNANVCQRTCTTDGSEPCSRCELCDAEQQLCTLPPEGNECVLPPAARSSAMASDLSPAAAASAADFVTNYLSFLYGRVTIAIDEQESAFSFDHPDAHGGSRMQNANLEAIARNCPGPECTVRLTNFNSAAADFTAVIDGADDERVSGIQIFMQQPTGLARSSDGGFVLPRFGMSLIMGYSVLGRHLIDAKNSADTDVVLDFDSGAFELSSSFPSADATIEIDLAGSISNYPPTARAGADALVECTDVHATLVALDGSGSSDREPGPGLANFLWYEGFDRTTGAGVNVATGPTPVVPLAKGPHRLTLAAQDGSGALDLDDVQIDVVDRTPPQPTCAGAMTECTGVFTPVVTSCSAVDACDPDVEGQSSAEESYPVGSHTFSCSATDDDGNSDSTSCEVIVEDTTPPIIELSDDDEFTVCHSDPQVLTLPFPIATDLCGDSDVVGELVAVRDRALEVPVPIPDDGRLLLPVAPFTVRWTAQDEHGNPDIVEQTFTVGVESSVACCRPGQTVVEGSPQRDNIKLKEAGDYCVLSGDGNDRVQTRDGSDNLFGDSGDDVLQCGGGEDAVFAGDGADVIKGSQAGSLDAHGEHGDDVIHANSSHASTLWGGPGDDRIHGSSGSDVIYPGPGRDIANGHAGDDTVTLFDACEAVEGKVLHGGPGSDTVVTPLSLAALRSRGVVVQGFENVVVDDSRVYLSACF